MIKGTVDRTFENKEIDPVISVKLDNGFEIEFFQQGLSDQTYIERANEIYELEKEASNG